MIHLLLGVAVVLFIIWLVFHAVGAIIHLLWLIILIALALWVLGLVRGRSRA